MKNITFPEANIKIAENQEQYNTVHAFHQPKDQGGSITMCFELTDEEVKEISKTKKLWIKQLTFNGPMTPIALSVNKNDLIEAPNKG